MRALLCSHLLHLALTLSLCTHLQLLQQATSSSNLGAFSGIQQMAGKSGSTPLFLTMPLSEFGVGSEDKEEAGEENQEW